jgi:hypothetical protein
MQRYPSVKLPLDRAIILQSSVFDIFLQVKVLVKPPKAESQMAEDKKAEKEDF